MFNYKKIAIAIPDLCCPFKIIQNAWGIGLFTGEKEWYSPHNRNDQDTLFQTLRPIIEYLMGIMPPTNNNIALPENTNGKKWIIWIIKWKDLASIDFLSDGGGCVPIINSVSEMLRILNKIKIENLNDFDRKKKTCLINIAILFMINFLNDDPISVTDYVNNHLFNSSFDSETTICPRLNYISIWDGTHRFSTVIYYNKLVKFRNGNSLKKYPLLQEIKQINQKYNIMICRAR